MVPIQLTGSAATGLLPDPTHPLAQTFFARVSALPDKVYGGRLPPKGGLYPQLAHYADYANLLGSTPAKTDWTPKAMASINRMYLNDQLGDCVIAGKYHSIGIWTGNEAGSPVLVQDGTVQKVYSIWNPGGQDNGCVITDVLDYMQQTGFPDDAGGHHKIDGYVACNWTSLDLVKAAIYRFGVLTLGINLPEAWANSAVWDVTNSQIVGGHDVTCVGYDDTGIYIASWGRIYRITNAAFTSKQWLEECWAMLAPDWYSAGTPASGFDLASLRNDLQSIGKGTVPNDDPGPAPGPGPGPNPNPPTPSGKNLYIMGLSLEFDSWTNGNAVGSIAQVKGTAKIQGVQ